MAQAAEEVMQTVHVLLGARHATERVLRVWGGSSVGTVAHTKAATCVLLKEFKASGDLVEARRCLHELAAPHYTHELVKQALTFVLEDPSCTEALFGMLKVRARACPRVTGPKPWPGHALEGRAARSHGRRDGFPKRT